jgi:predicted RNase H-like HicB family nuclease
MSNKYSAVITKEDDMFVSFCPELDIVSQGFTVEEANNNLKEAVELFIEFASESEFKQYYKRDVYYTQFEVAFG